MCAGGFLGVSHPRVGAHRCRRLRRGVEPVPVLEARLRGGRAVPPHGLQGGSCLPVQPPWPPASVASLGAQTRPSTLCPVSAWGSSASQSPLRRPRFGPGPPPPAGLTVTRSPRRSHLCLNAATVTGSERGSWRWDWVWRVWPEGLHLTLTADARVAVRRRPTFASGESSGAICIFLLSSVTARPFPDVHGHEVPCPETLLSRPVQSPWESGLSRRSAGATPVPMLPFLFVCVEVRCAACLRPPLWCPWT